MRKWLAGIAASVISAVVIWQITKAPPPPPPPPAYSLTGLWNFKMTSTQSHQTHQGTWDLTMDGTVVTGIMEPIWDNSSSGLKGTFANNVLDLERETGKQDTLQLYRLKRDGDGKFSGKFWNRGGWKDDGTIEIVR